MKRSGFKPKLTQRGRAILAGTAPKIRLDLDDGMPKAVELPPIVLRPRTPAPTVGLLAQAMAMNGPEHTARAIAALMKTPDRKSQKIRDSARGEECLMALPDCPQDPAMTIWSHAPLGEAGKGMQIKALDLCGAYACTSCDAALDGQRKPPPGLDRTQVLMAWFYAHMKSLVRLKQKGLA